MKHLNLNPHKEIGQAFAPTNIALIKYWGKRDEVLNLPLTDSLSLTLPRYGATTTVCFNDQSADQIFLNHQQVDITDIFYQKTSQFLNYFRPSNRSFTVNTVSDVPVAVGLASSASGFAALVLALNDFFGWELSREELSVLARRGSGSACRSLWNGFVHWQKGEKADGSDSHGIPIDIQWPTLCLGILLVSDAQKPISSRIAMQRTVQTSLRYQQWPKQVAHDMGAILSAIESQDFHLLGATAENNAIAMHATMADANPPIHYSLPATLSAMQKVWHLRRSGLPIYFTQDAGPNLKLLFLQDAKQRVMSEFPDLLLAF